MASTSARSIRLRRVHAYHRAIRAPASMSEILIAFAQPYTALVAKHDLQRYEGALHLAAALWNASLVPDPELAPFLQRIAEGCECDAETALEMVARARRRRLERFPGEHRKILRVQTTARDGLVRVDVST